MSSVRLLLGDCLERMKELDDGSVDCIVTSPPYYGLRDYGVDSQIGLEKTPEEYVSRLVAVFREARRCLRDDGTLWLNLGDTYGKRKDLLGVPWRVAFALQADGWTLRQDIIWSKPNPMPESVSDRCTKAHEYIFLLTKTAAYFYDAEAVREPHADTNTSRHAALKKHAGVVGAVVPGAVDENSPYHHQAQHRGIPGVGTTRGKFNPSGRNKRSVWTVPVSRFRGAHFATFPLALVEPCIKAGCPERGTVLDPFGGAGTVAIAALKHGRNSILVELNPGYIAIAEKRIAEAQRVEPDLFLEAAE